MSDLIGWLVPVLSVGILFYTLMEGRDERGKMILFDPLSVSFSYLLVGCYAVKLLDTYFSIDYKIALDIVIASALLIYIAILLRTRKWYS